MLRRDTPALTIVLAALTAIGPLSTDMYLPALIDIGQKLQSPPATTQLTLSVYLAGFAISQIVYGPLSDRYGRKPILIGSLVLYTLASLVCAAAPSMAVLIVGRALQAIGASGAIVLARAIVRDLYEGTRAGRELALMAAVMALAPMIGPLIGGVTLLVFGWRVIFLMTFAFGLVILAISWIAMPETATHRAQTPLSLGQTLRTFAALLRHRGFLAHLIIVTVSFAGLFAWISGSSFVLQELYGLSQVQFGIAFATAATGFLLGTAIASRRIYRWGFNRTIGAGAIALAGGGALMAAAVALRVPTAAALVVPMWLYLIGIGLALPQALAAALTPFPRHAGAASSLVGFAQMMFSAFVGAAVGHGIGHSAWPVAGTVAGMGIVTLTIWLLTRGVRATRPSDA